MRFKYATIDIDTVDCADTHFQISTTAATDALRISIQTAGLINAPILLPVAGRYRIISGFRRVLACRALNQTQVRARLVAPDNDALDCVRLAISENALQRDLNPVELSRCLRLLQPFYPQTQHMVTAARDLGMVLNAAYVRKLLPIGELSPDVRQAIADGRISVAVADELCRLGNATASELAVLFVELKIGLNKQREILRLSREIARREGVSIQAVIDRHEFQQIIRDRQLDRTQKARQLRAFLLQRRMPALTQARQRFAALAAKLNLPKAIKLVPPPDFEGCNYQLVCDFDNLAGLQRMLTALEKTTQSSVWSQILSPDEHAPEQIP